VEDQPLDKFYIMTASRTSLIVRLSLEDAARVRKEASSERRTSSGYLLYVIGRSIRIEASAIRSRSVALSLQARELIGPQNKKLHTAIQLSCTVDEAATIREYAAKRQLSIGDFVVFSLRRFWLARAQVEDFRIG